MPFGGHWETSIFVVINPWVGAVHECIWMIQLQSPDAEGNVPLEVLYVPDELDESMVGDPQGWHGKCWPTVQFSEAQGL